MWDDILAVILGKVGEASLRDLKTCTVLCKTLQRLYPDVLRMLNLNQTFPPPWDREPENSELLYECAKYGNLQAIFLCGLIDFYFRNETISGTTNLSLAAEANHPEAMYLYGMILINNNQLEEGSKFIKKLWREKGIDAVRECNLNCRPVVLELKVRQYRDYGMLLAQIEVGDDCDITAF